MEPQNRPDPEPTVQMIGTLPPWKGIPAYCKEMYEGIDERWEAFKFTGWTDLYPAALYPGGEPKTDEEPVEADNVERELSWYNPLSWISVGLDSDVELIHAQWWSYPLAIPYVSIFTLGKLRGKTILVTVHNVEPHEQNALTRFLNDMVYRFADEYVVHSEDNRAQFTEKTGIDPDDVHVIAHPTIGPEKRGLSTAAARAELGVDPDDGLVLFFGNIREYKGLDDLVRMVDELPEEAELVVAGECWVDWADYERLIDRHGMADRVHRVPGFVPEEELEPLFVAADVVALPYTEFDAQSGVAALANHFEAVSVGYDVGGLAEQVDVVPEDRESFVSSLAAAIAGDLDKSTHEDDTVENHLRLYRTLLDSPERATRPVR